MMESFDPKLAALALPAAIATKAIVSGIRRLFPRLRGNAVQTLTLLIAFLGTGLAAGARGDLADGATTEEVAGLCMLALMVGAGAIGVHELTQDRGGAK